jgi:hypothetical protein
VSSSIHTRPAASFSWGMVPRCTRFRMASTVVPRWSAACGTLTRSAGGGPVGSCRASSPTPGRLDHQDWSRKPLEALLVCLVGIYRRFIAPCYRRGCPAAAPDRLHNNLRHGRRVRPVPDGVWGVG